MTTAVPRTATEQRRPSHTPKQGHLSEVQALRALAVGVVVVYHLWPGRLPGGFVGVDVFFAISGFLITSHLVRPLLTGQRVDVLRFWSNRVWRLLPASLTVLVVCFLFTLWFTPVTVASNAFRQIAASAAYVVNWVLAVDSVDYLARDNEPTIVQHYWSLSVEEQFYLLWPLLLVAAVFAATRMVGRSTSPVLVRRAVSAGIVVVVIASFMYSVFLTDYAPARAYFDTFTRAWEFALGGLTAILVDAHRERLAALRTRPLIERFALPTWVGVALILGAAVFMSSETPFPSYWAAVPVLGAILIIIGGAPGRPWISRLAGSRPSQFLGDVSYSLYLWHWPLIVGFGFLVGRRHTFWEGCLLLAAAVALAWITKIAIEDPFRRIGRRTRNALPGLSLAVVGAVVFAAASAAVVTTRDAAASQAAEERAQAVTEPTSCLGAHATLGSADCPSPFELSSGVDPVLPFKDLNADWCLTWFDEDWRSCEFGDLDETAGTVAIVGDSHAAALSNPLGEELALRDMKLVTFTRFGCPALSPTAIGLRAQTPETEQACADWSARVTQELVERSDIDTVIYTSFESAYAVPEAPGADQLSTASIVATLRAVADSGKEVVLFRDLPATIGSDVPTCIASAGATVEVCGVTIPDAFPPGPFDSALAELGDSVSAVDLRSAMCDDAMCHALVGDVIVYADDNHVSETFARTLVPYLVDDVISGAKQ